MKKTYIQPKTVVEQVVINNLCLSVSTTAADDSVVLAPERDETMEWEEM